MRDNDDPGIVWLYAVPVLRMCIICVKVVVHTPGLLNLGCYGTPSCRLASGDGSNNAALWKELVDDMGT